MVRLGVSEYLVKPLRHASLVAKIDHLLRTLPKEHLQFDRSTLRIAPGHPTLVVDGDAPFRELVAAQVANFGEAIQAGSGAAALVEFRKTPADVVIIGTHLGVMSADRVATKIREVKPWGVRLIRVVDHADDPAGDLFDGVLVRTLVPETLRESLLPFVALASVA